MSQQKNAFIESEGDAWLARNTAGIESRDWARDPLCVRIAALGANRPLRILEIGCGDGSRLEYLATRYGHDVSGIDPSRNAVAKALERGVRAVQSTADQLPFPAAQFDVVAFGFCLYLCDDCDLFRIAQEADRVLASPGWLVIFDFETRAPVYRPYHHRQGIESRKMDYKSMFLWHPAYTLASHEKFHHVTYEWTDDPDEWVSVACLRKALR